MQVVTEVSQFQFYVCLCKEFVSLFTLYSNYCILFASASLILGEPKPMPFLTKIIYAKSTCFILSIFVNDIYINFGLENLKTEQYG